jgi:hypothetical protein
MDNDPAIAFQKLESNLAAIQDWLKKKKDKKAEGSKPIHITVTT